MAGGTVRAVVRLPDKDDTYWSAVYGPWLQRSREQKPPDGWTQDRAIEELYKLTSESIRRNWLSQLENGARPSPALYEAFRRLYGDPPAPQAALPDIGALVGALHHQAEAIQSQAYSAADLQAITDAIKEQTKVQTEQTRVLATLVKEMKVARLAEQQYQRGTLQVLQQALGVRASSDSPEAEPQPDTQQSPRHHPAPNGTT